MKAIEEMSGTELTQYVLELLDDPVQTEKFRQYMLTAPDTDPKLKAELKKMTFSEWLDKKSQPLVDAWHRAGGF